MEWRRFVYLGIGIIFFLVLLALTGTVQTAEKKEITIGYATALTGKFSVEGNDAQRGRQLWLEQVNRAGGLQVGNKRYPVKFIAYDDESDASTCTKLYEKLITRDNVDLILAPWGSGINFAASAVSEKYRYPMITSSAAATNIWERGFRYVFETSELSTTMAEPWLSFLKSYNNEIKTVVILYENFLFTVAMNESLVKFVQEAGTKLLLDEKYPIGGKDFTGILLKVKGLNPDAVLVLNLMPASVYATRQAREVGLMPKVFMVNIGPMFTKEFVEALGDLSEQVYESGFWHPDLPYKGAKDFPREFEAKFNRQPSTDATYAYVAAQVLEQAIRKAGTIDREKITETLYKEKFETIMGPIEYNQRGVNKTQRGFICQVQNKKRVIVWPRDLATAKPEFMR